MTVKAYVPNVYYRADKQNGVEAFKDDLGGTTSVDYSLLLNSTQVSATYVYGEGDLTATPTWPGLVGQTLTMTGSGTDPAREYGPVGSLTADYTLKLKSAKHLAYSSSGYGAVGSDDFVLWIALETPAGTSLGEILGDLGSSGGGYRIAWLTSTLYCQYSDDGGLLTSRTVALPKTRYIDLLFAVDQGTWAGVYAAGQQLSYTTSISSPGTITEDYGLALGESTVSGTTGYTGRILGAALWHSSGWLNSSPTAVQTLSQEMSSRFWGSYLIVSGDQVNGYKYPTTMTRSSEASLLREGSDGNKRIFYVYDNIIAKTYAPTKQGGSSVEFLDVQQTGINSRYKNLIAADSTNDPDGSDWTKVYLTRGTSAASPDPNVDAYSLDSDSSDGSQTHKIYTGSISVLGVDSSPTCGGEWCAGCVIKPENKSWVELWLTSDTSGAKFQLTGSGSATSTGTGKAVTQGVLYLGSSYYVIWIGGYSATGWSDSVELIIRDSGSSVPYVGTDGADVRFDHFFFMEGTSAPITIPDGGSQRDEDVLLYANHRGSIGSFHVDVAIFERYAPGPVYRSNSIIRSQSYTLPNNIFTRFWVQYQGNYDSELKDDDSPPQGDSAETSTGWDGETHQVSVHYDASNFYIKVDGVQGDWDTTITPIGTQDELLIYQPISKLEGFSVRDIENVTPITQEAYGGASAQSATIDSTNTVDAGLAVGVASGQFAEIDSGSEIDAGAADGDAAAQSAAIQLIQSVDTDEADAAVVGLSATILLGEEGEPGLNWSFEDGEDGEADHWEGTEPGTAEDVGTFS